MKRIIKTLSALLLAVALIIPNILVGTIVWGADPTGVTVKSVGGWNETLYLQASGVTDSNVTGVSYSGTMSGSLTGDDFTYLVRDYNGELRIDIPGLKPGTYSITVNTSKGTITRSGITVPAQDRSGYAHYNYTAGVGAYNDNGTLKANAKVIYVTDANKNTVTVTSKDGTTVTGIGNILNSAGQDVGGGKTANGGSKPNTNKGIIKKLAQDGTPLVVRIIGNVTAPAGVTAYDSKDYGGSEGDNGYMARMKSGKDITIEGIGVGATMNGWGIHFMAEDNVYGKSFEVRNINFRNVPEDCVGMEGIQEGSTLTKPVERCWIHNCSFYAPTIANPAESDKDGGDGACDFKRGQYFTNSYCYYSGYHKTNLVGGSDSNLQYHLTYHHNYWKNCESRGPLARQANIHMYNNVFDGQTSYCMNPRANAYIFSEYNLFQDSKDPVEVKSGAVKSYNDTFTNCRGNNHATVVSNKSQTVSTSNKYANFDTNASISYIPSGNYTLHTDKNTLKATVAASAGAQGTDVTVTDNGMSGGSSGGNTGGDSGSSGGSSGGSSATIPAGAIIHNFTTDGKTSQYFTISGNLSTSKGTVSYSGLTLTQCLKIESSTNISFTTAAKSKLTLVFGGSTSASGKNIKVDGAAKTIDSTQVVTVELEAGTHKITKGDSINLFLMQLEVEGTGSDGGGSNEDPTQGNQGGSSEDPTQGNQGGSNEDPTQGNQGGSNEDPTQGNQGGSNEDPTQGNQGGSNEDPTQGNQGGSNEDPTQGNQGGSNEDPTQGNQGGSDEESTKASASNPTQTKDGGNGATTVILIIVLILILAAAGFVVYKLIKTKKNLQ
ncbi:MAG: hypothetical protein E7252_05905 [Lachnospira sp.]|nr:hypothetical protein [Lachnospira sp.]